MKGATMNIKEAIEVLEDLKRLSTVPIVIKSCINTKLLNEAIDTVLSLINTGNKTGLDDSLQELSIEVSDNQASLSYKKDIKLQSDEQIEQYALENILDGVGIQSMINTKAWIAGAIWMRDLIKERRAK